MVSNKSFSINIKMAFVKAVRMWLEAGFLKQFHSGETSSGFGPLFYAHWCFPPLAVAEAMLSSEWSRSADRGTMPPSVPPATQRLTGTREAEAWGRAPFLRSHI